MKETSRIVGSFDGRVGSWIGLYANSGLVIARLSKYGRGSSCRERENYQQQREF